MMAKITTRRLLSLSSTLFIISSSVAWVANGFAIGSSKLQSTSLLVRPASNERRFAISSRRYSTVTPETEAAATAFNEDDVNDDNDNDESTVNIVLTTGFESFNRALYQTAGQQLLPPPLSSHHHINLQVFADSDIQSSPQQFAHAVRNADMFIGSLIFDYDDVQIVSELLSSVKGPRLLFECATELMEFNRVGTFNMEAKEGGGGSDGPPPAVKAILNKFSSGKEEDKINGYLKMLKVGPDLLKFIPG